MYNIIAPIGGFGNHLRLLMLLSKDLTWRGFKVRSTIDKIEFIREKIYPPTRTWQNWLEFEWQFRRNFDQIIVLSHDLKVLTNNQQSILLTASPGLCLSCYIKFNSNLNNTPIDLFKQGIEDYNNIVNTMIPKTNKFLVVSADVLFNEKLDEDFYNRCINFLQIENEFDNASMIHSIWYNLHMKAQKDIAEFYYNLY